MSVDYSFVHATNSVKRMLFDKDCSLPYIGFGNLRWFTSILGENYYYSSRNNNNTENCWDNLASDLDSGVDVWNDKFIRVHKGFISPAEFYDRAVATGRIVPL